MLPGMQTNYRAADRLKGVTGKSRGLAGGHRCDSIQRGEYLRRPWVKEMVRGRRIWSIGCGQLVRGPDKWERNAREKEWRLSL